MYTKSAVHKYIAFPMLLPMLLAIAGVIAPVSSAAAQKSAIPAPPTVSASALDTMQTVAISGVVYDSVARAPLAGASVQLVEVAKRERSYTVTADSSGRFEIPRVRTGQYLAGFFHPSLDALGLEPPLKLVTVGAAPIGSLNLAIPAPARVVAALCGARPAADSTGAMVGVVRNADNGAPAPGATVIVSWTDVLIDRGGLRSERRRVPARVRDDGSYAICGLPGDDQIIGSAEAPGRQTGLIEIHVPANGIVRRDFSLGDSASVSVLPSEVQVDSSVPRAIPGRAPGVTTGANTIMRGSARLAGSVRGPDRHPIGGAKVLVWGTGVTAVSGGDGKFEMEGLPAGTFSVEARALGFTPTRTAVDLASGTTASVVLAVSERANTLSTVTVMGKRSNAARDLTGFLQRSRSGFGHYITAADIERRSTIDITDALRTTPGLRVSPGRFGYQVYARGGCSPEVYLDGMRMYQGAEDIDQFVRPEQVAGIEVYTGVAGAPMQYPPNGCGSILIWTKH